MISSEATAFTRTVGRILSRHEIPGAWLPDRPCDDRDSGLEAELRAAGWPDAAIPGSSDVVAAVSIELGRAIAPLSLIDALLGAAPICDGVARYPGRSVMQPSPHGMRQCAVLDAQPVPYGDCIAAHLVTPGPETYADDGIEGPWIRALIGYMAGLADGALGLAAQHARTRSAFGATLAALDAVQAHLADAFAAVEGLGALALSDEPVDHGALAHAGNAACDVMAHCHQVVGAIGFTLEFPLQRRSRRARVMNAWNASWIRARAGYAISG